MGAGAMGDHDIVWFEIPMHDSHFVSVRESGPDLKNDIEKSVYGKLAIFDENFSEREAFDKLKDQIWHLTFDPEIVKDDGISMAKSTVDASFLDEPLIEVFIGDEVGMKDFDRDWPLHEDVLSTEYGTHSSLAKSIDNLVSIVQRGSNEFQFVIVLFTRLSHRKIPAHPSQFIAATQALLAN